MRKVYFRILSLVFCALSSGAYAACSSHSSTGNGTSGVLGTSRIIELDAKKHVNFNGREKALGLRNKEVILTFDDGPLIGKTNKVLASLKQECVKATFFVVGKMARAYPKLAKQIVKDGHTLAHHTFNHNRLPKYSIKTADKHITQGIRLVQKAAYGATFEQPKVPFFRFPYLATNKATKRLVKQKNFISFGTNIDSLDWKKHSPQTIVDRVMKRLASEKKGIILMHDIHIRTTKAVPLLLKRLKAKGYKIVHIVPKRAPSKNQENDNSDSLLLADLSSDLIDDQTDQPDQDVQYAAISANIDTLNQTRSIKKWKIRKTESLLDGFIIAMDDYEFEENLGDNVQAIEIQTNTLSAPKKPAIDRSLITNGIVVSGTDENSGQFGANPLNKNVIKQWALRTAFASF
ncbi:MAG: polysaccharide deacetylase family protein [Nitratireductor sp.]